jgi:hypothetical protein
VRLFVGTSRIAPPGSQPNGSKNPHLCQTPAEVSYMGIMLNWLHKFLQTKYVALLEAEVTRLRGENRALMNSLLGTAGFPPVDFPEPPKQQPLPRLRKRSWHQIQAWKEAESTK